MTVRPRRWIYIQWTVKLTWNFPRPLCTRNVPIAHPGYTIYRCDDLIHLLMWVRGSQSQSQTIRVCATSTSSLKSLCMELTYSHIPGMNSTTPGHIHMLDATCNAAFLWRERKCDVTVDRYVIIALIIPLLFPEYSRSWSLLRGKANLL